MDPREANFLAHAITSWCLKYSQYDFVAISNLSSVFADFVNQESKCETSSALVDFL